MEYLEKNFGMKPERVEISKGNHPAKEAVYFAGIRRSRWWSRWTPPPRPRGTWPSTDRA